MNTNQVKPNRYDNVVKLLAKTDITAADAINKNEAHLTHLVILTSKPNMGELTFTHSLKTVKVTPESFDTIKTELERTEGTLAILHDGKEYAAEKRAGKLEVVTDDDKAKKLELEEKAQAAADKETELAEKEQALADKEKALAEKSEALKSDETKKADEIAAKSEEMAAKEKELAEKEKAFAAREKELQKAEEKAAKAAAKADEKGDGK